MEEIGIFGGTFNPVHKAHINLAVEAKEEFGLDEVWFMPTLKSPHKDNKYITDINTRMDMIKLALEDYEYLSCSDFELRISSEIDKNYTYYTLQRLKQFYRDINLYFIIGADSLYEIESWKNPDIIMSLATLLVAGREYENKSLSMESMAGKLRSKYSADIRFIDFKEMDISSHTIREMVANNEDASEYLPQKVYNYIKENNLYKN